MNTETASGEQVHDLIRRLERDGGPALVGYVQLLRTDIALLESFERDVIGGDMTPEGFVKFLIDDTEGDRSKVPAGVRDYGEKMGYFAEWDGCKPRTVRDGVEVPGAGVTLMSEGARSLYLANNGREWKD